MNNITKDEKKLWDEYAEYSHKLEKTEPYQNIAERIGNFMEAKPEGVVLDAGCGIGGIFEKIITNIDPAKIVAVDFNEKMIEQAKKRAEKIKISSQEIEFKNINLLEPLPFNDNSFDAIISNSALCYIFEFKNKRGEDGLRSLLTEMHRILKPKGYLCWTAFTKSMDIKKLYSHYGEDVFKNAPAGFIGGIGLKEEHEQSSQDFLSIEEIQKIHGEVGFKNFQTNYVLAQQLVVMKAGK